MFFHLFEQYIFQQLSIEPTFEGIFGSLPKKPMD